MIPTAHAKTTHPNGALLEGMEEVALYEKGKERVYIRKRAGFIKYALQHGYLLQLA